ncbi:hypothetical protein KW439_00210 [Vibrio fluvialis]|nr:hypothetical protein [Vibrio fluvialis]
MNILFLVTPLIALSIAVIFTYFGVWRGKSVREKTQLAKTNSIIEDLRQERVNNEKKTSTDTTTDSADLKEALKELAIYSSKSVLGTSLGESENRVRPKVTTTEEKPILDFLTSIRQENTNLSRRGTLVVMEGSLSAQSETIREIIRHSEQMVRLSNPARSRLRHRTRKMRM